jgi:tetratricopeptide (TPR) repeat protein
MTGFLISKGMDVRLQGSKTASERIYQLAIDLTPNCPQPYTELANLYGLQSSYLIAADFYHRAAELAGMEPIAGRYSFEEGFIHVRHTGLIDQAIPALEKAEKITDWERSSWHQGAATFFLGTAYEEKGMLEEAIFAYQRVVDCLECTAHHEYAQARLDKLKNIKSQY